MLYLSCLFQEKSESPGVSNIWHQAHVLSSLLVWIQLEIMLPTNTTAPAAKPRLPVTLTNARIDQETTEPSAREGTLSREE